MTPPEPLAPLALSKSLTELYLSYYETAYAIRDPKLAERRRHLLREGAPVAQEPFLELLPDYPAADVTTAELCAAVGLPELTSLLEGGLLRGIHRPYVHQAKSLRSSLDGSDIVVT